MSIRRDPTILTYAANAAIPTDAPVRGNLVAGQFQVGRYLESLYCRLNSGTSGTFQPVGWSEEAQAWLPLCPAAPMATGEGRKFVISVQEPDQFVAFIVSDLTGGPLVLHVQPEVTGA